MDTFWPVFLTLLFATCATTNAQHTAHVVVRALATDAKFIGTSMGGASVAITDAATGDTSHRG